MYNSLNFKSIKENHMLKQSLLTISITVLLATGCSSYPSDAKGVAVGVCKAIKKLDFEGMKLFSVKESHKSLDQAKAMIDASKMMVAKLPEEQRKKAEVQMQQGLVELEAIDCSTMVISDGENGMKYATLSKGPRSMQKIKMKQVDGQWKIMQ